MTALLDFIVILLNFPTIKKMQNTWDKFRELKKIVLIEQYNGALNSLSSCRKYVF